MDPNQAWLEARQYSEEQKGLARLILEDVRAGATVKQAVRRHPMEEGGYIGKPALVQVYRELVDEGEWELEPALLEQLRLKPVRTLSGVTTVTVLTKPYPCSGKCIFCPTDSRMPKSYLPDEPGAMRGLYHDFDPYEQTAARIAALEAIAHPTDKIELLILGGTWSAYTEKYQEWFLKCCLDAMNGFTSRTLTEAQKANESAPKRNVGLVIETRPDQIDTDEIVRLRRYGVTKVQIGVQCLDDEILRLNRRGHTVQQTREAFNLLRAAGLKIVAHWMPNLLGATLESDRRDFLQLWEDVEIRPDEIKIYPCQLLENAELYEYWIKGEYQPYTTEELVDLIADVKTGIPAYCRVNRVIRDIPSDNIVEGNKRTSLRQDVHREMERRGTVCNCIRCREVRGKSIAMDVVELHDLQYEAGWAEEHFISFDTPEGDLVGYLRLSLPGSHSRELPLLDIKGAAIIREVHIYGQSLEVGMEAEGIAQHSGFGGQLIEYAEQAALGSGFRHIGVIAALGTRGYYRRFGYELGETYMVKKLG